MKKIGFSVLSVLFMLAMVFSTLAVAPMVAKAAGGCKTYTVHVIHDADSSNSAGNGSGYWAMDDLQREVTLCATETPGQLVGYLSDGSGSTFTTFGGTSPNGTGTIGSGITGSVTGSYTVIINGTIDPSAPSNLGTLDLACNDQGQCASSGTAATLDLILNSGFSYTIQDGWGWTYTACDGSTWVNSAAANTGDITLQAQCPKPTRGEKSCAWALEKLQSKTLVNKDEASRWWNNPKHKFCKNAFFKGYYWYWRAHPELMPGQ